MRVSLRYFPLARSAKLENGHVVLCCVFVSGGELGDEL